VIAYSPAPVLRTARLRLRWPRRNDAARIARLADDAGVARMTGSMPLPYRPADAEAFLARVSENDPSREAVFAIDHPEDGLIGTIGLSPNADGRSELGYWLGRPYWGRGYATEAADAALAFARDGWGRRQVVAGHHADNDASGWVLVKAGFLYTGEVRRTYSRARAADVPTRMMVWLA
jgi:RimJ/RimL family protein N-acetyltransferase